MLTLFHKKLGPFVDLIKKSIKLYPKTGSSTDSLVIKSETFIFSEPDFNAKSIKATLLILKLVLFAILKFIFESPQIALTKRLIHREVFHKRLTIDPVFQSPLNFAPSKAATQRCS